MKIDLSGKKHFLNVAKYGDFLEDKNNGLSPAVFEAMKGIYESGMKGFCAVEVTLQQILPNGLVEATSVSRGWRGTVIFVPMNCLRAQEPVLSTPVYREPVGKYETGATA